MQLFHLTEFQKGLLADQMRETGTRLLALNFQNPADDQATIRHHAYLKGKLEAFQLIFDDNFEHPNHEQQPEGT